GTPSPALSTARVTPPLTTVCSDDISPPQAHVRVRFSHSDKVCTISDVDVTEQNFQTAVIDRSHTVPVVVDFWAEWCGPCRQLGPLLERAAAARSGQVDLVKIDVDSNQNLASTFGIQGIPAVKAFRDGRVASEFVG